MNIQLGTNGIDALIERLERDLATAKQVRQGLRALSQGFGGVANKPSAPSAPKQKRGHYERGSGERILCVIDLIDGPISSRAIRAKLIELGEKSAPSSVISNALSAAVKAGLIVDTGERYGRTGSGRIYKRALPACQSSETEVQ